MLGFPLLYFKGMRLRMFQLSSFYCILLHPEVEAGDRGAKYLRCPQIEVG